MAIEVQCAACGKRLKAPDSQAGRVGKCPACKSEIVIPGHAADDMGLGPMPDLPVPTSAAKQPAASSAPAMKQPAPSSREFASPPERFAGPAASSRVSAFASTMDDDFGLPPQALPPQAVPDASQAIGPEHWFALKVVLKVTELALLVVWISISVLGLGIVSIGLMAGSGSPGDVTTLQVITVLMMWAIVGMVLGWIALATGWITGLMAWPSERKFLMGSAISAGVCIFAVLLVTSFQMLGITSGAVRGPAPAGPFPSSTAIMVLGSLASCASLISYSFFLNSIQRRLERVGIERQPIIYAAVIGTLTLWCLIANLAIRPSSKFMTWLIIFSNLGTFIGEFLWLWLVNAFTSRDLRVNKAWKRL